MSHSTGLHVRLFGEPRVEATRSTVALSPQQLTLVTLVYGHGAAGLSRARAATLLWGSEVDAPTRQRLRQLLLDVKRRAGTSLIEAHADRLRPRPGVLCDLDELQRALEDRMLARAAEIVRQGFARDLRERGTDALLDWRDAVQDERLRQVRAAASAAWSSASAASDWSAARDAAEALYLLDTEDAANVKRVIEACAHTGSLDAAEAVFASFREARGGSAEVPDELTEAIERARRLGRLGAAREAETEVPLIGRAPALAAARSIFELLKENRFGFVLISGESGIGKTRLLKEVRREALVREIRCLDAQAVELESKMPLTPLVDALGDVDLAPHLDALGRPWSAVIAAVLPARSGTDPLADLPPVQDSALSRRLLDALFQLLERLAQEQPTILFLDDLHWADATTVATLQFLQRRWVTGPLGIVATVRPELVGHADPLASYLSRSEELVIERVELRELSAEEALALVHRIGAGQLSGETAERICALAGPHPLYLTELTRDYLAGRMKLPVLPADEVTVPVSLKQILDARLARLSAAAMQVAGLLAVGARPLRLSTVVHLSGFDLDTAADAVEELRRCRLVEVERDSARISHELFRSAIYHYLGEARRALKHRAFAAWIESEPVGDQAGELAIHYARAGERQAAAKYARLAAVRAMETGALAEAAHFYQVVAESDTDRVSRVDALGEAAHALHLTGNFSQASPLLRRAAEGLRVVGKASDARRLEVNHLEGLANIDTTASVDVLEELRRIKAEARTDNDWLGTARALDAELHLLSHAEDVEGVRNVFTELRHVANSGGKDAAVLAHAGLTLGVFFGDPREALASGLEAVRLTEGDSGLERFKALNRLIIVLYHRGELSQKGNRIYVDAARSLAEKSGDRLQRYSLESNLAAYMMDIGDLEAAEVLLDRAAKILGSAEMTFARVNLACNRSELAFAKCDFAAAENALREADTYLGRARPRYTAELVNAGLGLCAIECGSLSEARRREQCLSEIPPTWCYDPTLVVSFRARVLELRGQTGAALDLLAWTTEDLRERMVLAWLKVTALRVRLMRKYGRSEAPDIAREGLTVARRLHLAYREAELEGLLT